jgi:hypothetical protein
LFLAILRILIFSIYSVLRNNYDKTYNTLIYNSFLCGTNGTEILPPEQM